MESFCIPDSPDSPNLAVSAVPTIVLGFPLQVELNDTQPPVWCSIMVPGNIHPDILHALLQAAMGWEDSHLHQFRQGENHHSPQFLTDFDITEGDQGIRKADVRLDQVLSNVGE